jgi:hypothetical protein
VNDLATAVQATTRMPTPLIVETLCRWIEDGTVGQIINWHRREATARQALARDVLKACAGRGHTVSYHIWLQLPEPWWRHQKFNGWSCEGPLLRAVTKISSADIDPLQDHAFLETFQKPLSTLGVNVMNRFTKTAAAVAVGLFLAAGGANAAEGRGAHAGPGFMRGEGPAEMGYGQMQHVGRGKTHGGPGLTQAGPAQIEALKSELGITPAQEPAWTNYVKTIQDAAATMKTTRDNVDRDAIGKISPQDRYAFVTKMREQRRKQFEAVKTTADQLVATLDDRQKAKAREILPGLASFGSDTMHGAAMSGPRHGHRGQ